MLKFSASLLALVALAACASTSPPDESASSNALVAPCATTNVGTFTNLSALDGKTFTMPAGGAIELTIANPPTGWVIWPGFTPSHPDGDLHHVRYQAQQSTPVGRHVIKEWDGSELSFAIDVTPACGPYVPFVGGTNTRWPVTPNCLDLGPVQDIRGQLDGKTFDLPPEEWVSFSLVGLPELQFKRASEIAGSASSSSCGSAPEGLCDQVFSFRATEEPGHDAVWEVEPSDPFYAYEPSLHARFTVRSSTTATCAK